MTEVCKSGFECRSRFFIYAGENTDLNVCGAQIIYFGGLVRFLVFVRVGLLFGAVLWDAGVWVHLRGNIGQWSLPFLLFLPLQSWFDARLWK